MSERQDPRTYHAFVGDLEGSGAGYLVEDRPVGLVLVGNQVAVQVVGEVRLGDLVAQHGGAGDPLADGRRHCK